MNFLAHLYLSGERSKLLVGNFIGDFVKGRNAVRLFEPEIIQGIELHRAIDDFTDKHAVVTLSKNRLRPKYRHYSPVIVDVFYDHFLAKNWSSFHPAPLIDFAAGAYETILRFQPILPQTVKRMLPYMISGNWLVHYAKTEGVHRALSGMASRTPYDSKMDEATRDLVSGYDSFESEFEAFFPDLVSYCQSRIREMDQARA